MTRHLRRLGRRRGATPAAVTSAAAGADDAVDAVGLRWPWALLAAALGAAGGAAVALVARRQLSDAPTAQEPHELRAVVDRPAPEPPG